MNEDTYRLDFNVKMIIKKPREYRSSLAFAEHVQQKKTAKNASFPCPYRVLAGIFIGSEIKSMGK